MKLALIVVSAILLERLIGQADRWQLSRVGFDWLVRHAEFYCYGPQGHPAWMRLTIGGLLLVVLIAPFALIAGMLANIPYIGGVAEVGLLALTLQSAELRSHAQTIAQSLQENDLAQARQSLKDWVDHDTAPLDDEGVSVATIETLLKRSQNGLFGVIFWYLMAGVPGAIVFRLTMLIARQWGYPTPRYRYFGWASARLAALVSWIPCQLTALSYSMAGDRETAWRCWRRQTFTWPSPSAGALLATGAGALRLQLGGPIYYFQRRVIRPTLGAGVLPNPQDISRALSLVDRALGIWLGVLVIGAWGLS